MLLCCASSFYTLSGYHIIIILWLSEALGSEGEAIKASLQAWRYFNPGSQAALLCMLPDWTLVQKSNMGQCEKYEDDIKKRPFILAYPNFSVGFWAGAKHSSIPKNVPTLCLLTGIAIQLVCSVPQTQPIRQARRQYNAACENITS